VLYVLHDFPYAAFFVLFVVPEFRNDIASTLTALVLVEPLMSSSSVVVTAWYLLAELVLRVHRYFFDDRSLI
jgi:hypothetical protein